jgi:hypothetical protein
MGTPMFPRRALFVVALFAAVPIAAYLLGAPNRRMNPLAHDTKVSAPAVASKIESHDAKLTASASNATTHTQAYTIMPEIKGKKVSLQTFCVGPKGQLWMACQLQSSSNKGALMVYEPDGKLLHTYPLDFVPQAINFAPHGKLYVAGSGKIAKIASDGSVEKEIDAPNIANREEAIASVTKSNDEANKKLAESLSKQTKVIQEQLAKLEQAPEGEKVEDKRKRETRIKMLQQQIKTLASTQTQSIARKPTAEQSLLRLMRSTAIAATEKDVFVSLPESSGYGYGVWRLSPDLAVDKVVLKGGRGCCGQFDIQTDGEHLIIAENTKFQVGIYDRDGKRLNGFGSKTRGGDEGFGSCCNPMNVRCCENGEILTAESSIGHIKRFSLDGKYLGFVGTAKVAGGCKHVAIGFDPERNYYYMMHEDLSHVAVLIPKSDAPATSLTQLQ